MQWRGPHPGTLAEACCNLSKRLAVAATAILVKEADRLTLGRDLTLKAPYTAETLLIGANGQPGQPTAVKVDGTSAQIHHSSAKPVPDQDQK